MASPSGKKPVTITPPAEMIPGPDNSVFLVMSGLGAEPSAGRLLRGLTPYLDANGATNVVLMTERKRREPWSAAEGSVPYQELVHWHRDEAGGVYHGTTCKGHELTQAEIVKAFQKEPAGMIEWAARRKESAVVCSGEPLLLEPCIIPKPWGREVWYTGIEKRGVSRVRSATGSTELPYALGMFPVPLVGEGTPSPILLKTLEPWPDAVLGDLYLEMHREKWEVYVVLEVDPQAWPEGVGCLRAGLHPDRLAAYSEEHGAMGVAALVNDLREAIRAYEQVRERIDALLDEEVQRRGDDPAAPREPALQRELLAGLPAGLHDEEARLREGVEGFLGLIPLRAGDVVCLPPGVLHSLQHGIRVVEFQTPTYERLIAMFAQKVLTQSHWDTDAALDAMHREAYQPPALVSLPTPAGMTAERVVDFPQFQVDRYGVSAGTVYAGRTEGEGAYQLLFVVAGSGELRLPGGGAWPLTAETAMLLPAQMGPYAIQAGEPPGLTFLLSYPRPGEPAAGGAAVRNVPR